MPFVREIIPADGIRAGIWHITETAGELLAQVHLNEHEQVQYASFSHDLRKRHWLAYRALLLHLLYPLSSEIFYDLNGKPHLVSGSHHISVAHAGVCTVVACSKNSAVGVDVEQLRNRVERVKERFLLKTELESLSRVNRLEHLYVYWCGKEALYKLKGLPDIDFQKDIHIHPFDYLCNTKQTCLATLTVNDFPEEHRLYYEKLADYMLVVAY
jgi:4'-phosphopantetheinyl transferase